MGDFDFGIVGEEWKARFSLCGFDVLLVMNGIDDEKFARVLGVAVMIVVRKEMIGIDGVKAEGSGVTAVFAFSLCVFCIIE